MRWYFLALFVVAGVVILLLARDDGDEVATVVPLPEAATFVGSRVCRECHEKRHEAWLDTAHAYSLRAPEEGIVEGRFDGVPVETAAFTVTPFRREGGFYMKVERRDGRAPGEFLVTRVVGRTFEQAYLFTDQRGAWRVLPLSWSIERKEWDLTHEILNNISGNLGTLPADYDSRQVVFNHGCGQCHATNYSVGHSVAEDGVDTYDTTFLEGAVACESCHGAGSVHVAWHEQERDGEYEEPARLLNPPEDLTARGVLESCGRCHYAHEWRHRIADDPRVGWADIAVTTNHDRPGFLPDGRIVSLNYHGTTQVQSACFSKGQMSCLSCHRLHGRKKWALRWDGRDDAQCVQCHDEERFEGKRHSFHDGDVACVDCHMPRLLPKRGILHFVRDHSIQSPEPALTERFGARVAPNACNACHVDRNAAWAREWKEKWFGPPGDDLKRLGDVMATLLALRKAPDAVPTDRVAAIATDRSNRLFFRTSATWELGRRDDPAAATALRALLGADEPVDVLQLACLALGARPDPRAAGALLALLDHPARTVRVEAGYALARSGWRGTNPAFERVYADAVAMLDRQHAFVTILERIAWIADVIGKPDDVASYLPMLARRDPAKATGLIQRHGRHLTETGRHAAALAAYAEVRGLLGEPLPALLYIDSADSMAALRDPQVVGAWESVLDLEPKGSVLLDIARARLLGARGRAAEAIAILEPIEKSLEPDPSAGELLRRVRWSLRALR